MGIWGLRMCPEHAMLWIVPKCVLQQRGRKREFHCEQQESVATARMAKGRDLS